MKRYDDLDDVNTKTRRPKHSKNRPGEGIRVLNKYVEEELYFDEEDDFNYNYDTSVKNDRKR
jgi:hypothetical protein